jgi:hypothetical protein
MAVEHIHIVHTIAEQKRHTCLHANTLIPRLLLASLARETGCAWRYLEWVSQCGQPPDQPMAHVAITNTNVTATSTNAYTTTLLSATIAAAAVTGAATTAASSTITSIVAAAHGQCRSDAEHARAVDV